MSWLFETAIGNAILATALAAVAVGVSQFLRRPALVHALWVLVLLKLVTPPLFPLPVPVTVERRAEDASLSRAGESTASVREAAALDSPAPLVSDPAEGPVADPSSPLAPGTGTAVERESATARSENGARPTGAEATGTVTVAAAATSAAAPRSLLRYWPWAAGLLWAAGCGAWLAANVVRLRAFRRALTLAAVRDERLERRAEELAAVLQLRTCPRVLVIDAPVSPLLWGCGRRAVIVLPGELLEQLDDAGRDSLLLHELAHFRRGDHWVRLLELIVTGLYWWHPVVWLARREIERTEEECCDAWVVEQFPDAPRRYAEALLAALDFISERGAALPPATSGVAGVPAIERRLRQIMRDRVPKSVSRPTRWLLAGLIFVLPAQPVLRLVPAEAAPSSLSDGRLVTGIPGLDGRETAPFPPADSNGAPGRAAPDPRLAPPPPDDAVLNSPIFQTAPPDERWAGAVSPGGRFRLTAEVGGRVSLVDVQTGRGRDLSAIGLQAAAFLPDGESFIAGLSDGSVRRFDAATAQPVFYLGRHRGDVRSLDVSPDGRQVVSGSAEGQVIAWRLDAAGGLRELSNVGSAVSCIRFSQDGRAFAVAVGDWRERQPRIVVYDAATLEAARVLAPGRPVGALRFDDRETLISSDWEGRTTEWNLATGSPVAFGVVDKEAVSEASFSPDNGALATIAPLPPSGRELALEPQPLGRGIVGEDGIAEEATR